MNIMKKPAITKYKINPLLEERWSPRAFDSKPVEKEKIQSILEAARWSPSSFNEQPWRFIVGAKGSKTHQMIFDTLIDFNQKWTISADVLVLTIGKKTLSSNGKPNDVFQYDLGQSVAHMTVQATHDGLFMHQMGGFSKEKAVSLFNIPEDYEPVTAFALGYIGKPEDLDANFRKMEESPRQRKPLSEIAFENTFGETNSLIKD
jgi:nitroreductase